MLSHSVSSQQFQSTEKVEVSPRTEDNDLIHTLGTLQPLGLNEDFEMRVML